jgi:hypothetical protein
MNKVSIIVLITFSALSVFGQNFEGKITYANTYKSKTNKITDQQLQTMMGGIQEYYIKNGNYKSVMNGNLMQWQLYVNNENKLYSKMKNSETAYWSDALVNSDSILNVKINKNVTKVLDYNCDELILTTLNGNQKYYFNTSLKINTSLFKNHKLGNWYAFLKESNSLPLKMILSNPQFTIESIATEVKNTKIKASDMILPTHQKTAKSPY